MISNLNEIITLLTVYHLFCFTDFVSSNETKAVAVGNSMMFITLINLIVNIGPILPNIARNFKKRGRKVYLWLREKKAIRREVAMRKRRFKKELLFKEHRVILKQMLENKEFSEEFYEERLWK